MITYTFKVLEECDLGKVGEVIEVNLPLSAYDEFKKDFEGILERYIDAPPGFTLNGATVTTGGTDNTFKEVMQKIGEKYKGSNLDRQYNKRTIKESKTDQVLKRYRDKQASLRKS